MKKVLIATTNNDKYSAVSKIFRNTIFKEDEYVIESLKTINVVLEDKKEEGDNIHRAKVKAQDAYNQLKEYNFDYIVGLDDAVRIKGILEPNIKEYLNKILFENYIDDGEEYSFCRAYCFIDKEGNMYETTIDIPYIYHKPTKEVDLTKGTYPLSYVAYPIGYNKPVNELSEDEEIDYYITYVKDAILSLKLK